MLFYGHRLHGLAPLTGREKQCIHHVRWRADQLWGLGILARHARLPFRADEYLLWSMEIMSQQLYHQCFAIPAERKPGRTSIFGSTDTAHSRFRRSSEQLPSPP